MKSMQKRIERLEKAWLPHTGEKIQFLWEDFLFLKSLNESYPDPSELPRFLQAELRRFHRLFKPKQAESRPPQPNLNSTNRENAHQGNSRDQLPVLCLVFQAHRLPLPHDQGAHHVQSAWPLRFYGIIAGAVTYIEPILFTFLAICFLGVLLNRKRLVIAGLAGAFLSCWHPVAWLLSRPLELWFPPATIDGRLAQAIVVPGSDYDDPTLERPFPVADRDTYGRCLLAAWLYNQGLHVPVLVSGHWATGIMRGILESEGVPAASIWEETAAHSTHENAVFSAKALREHHLTTIVVLSDARSMLRVKKSFEKEGFSVIPAVWTRLELIKDVRHLLPGWMALQSNENTLHEVIGLIWYRVRGWI